MKNIQVKDLKILCKFTNLESKGSEAEVESSGKGQLITLRGDRVGNEQVPGIKIPSLLLTCNCK